MKGTPKHVSYTIYTCLYQITYCTCNSAFTCIASCQKKQTNMGSEMVWGSTSVLSGPNMVPTGTSAGGLKVSLWFGLELEALLGEESRSSGDLQLRFHFLFVGMLENGIGGPPPPRMAGG